ncbi:hypothetical protein RQP46_009451 [Phenoliferia psychrophenolica]
MVALINSKATAVDVARAEPIGVAAAVRAHNDPTFVPRPRIFEEFSLAGRVGVVTGAYGGLGLEMALALCEAGAFVYAIDVPTIPSADFEAAAEAAKRFGTHLVYIHGNATDPSGLAKIFQSIVAKHHRLDVLIAAAAILGAAVPCTEFVPDEWRKVMEVNCNGVFFCAQAAAKVMQETGTAGSIILIASMSGSIVNRGHDWSAYSASKSAVLQMARSLACELGHLKIRVNTISPGHIYTKMTAQVLDVNPELGKKWADSNPLAQRVPDRAENLFSLSLRRSPPPSPHRGDLTMATSAPRRVLGISLKMYFDPSATVTYATALLPLAALAASLSLDLFFCPDFLGVASTSALIRSSTLVLGAQDCCEEEEGAFTGEVSAKHLAKLGIVARKARAALRNGITPLICIGESTHGSTSSALSTLAPQISSVLNAIPSEGDIVFAYEPVFAIEPVHLLIEDT